MKYFQHHSKRFIIFGWRIFTIIALISYAAMLHPLLTSNKAGFKYESVDSMLENPDFRFTMFGGGSTNALLEVNQVILAILFDHFINIAES